MKCLKWSTSHVVFVPAMDDEHKEIFQSLSALQAALSNQGPRSQIGKLVESLAGRVEDHFAHEERIMRAARYGSYRWHKKAHDAARKRVGEFVSRIQQDEDEAGPALIDYASSWLHEHMRVADMMLGAFLRNHQRSLYRMTFRAGTKPIDACPWFDSKGEPFDPSATTSGY